MAKTPYDHYLKEILFQREVWHRKPVLQKSYEFAYQLVVERMSPQRPVVEIGSGSGNFKAYCPETVATDVFRSGPWIDRIVNAEELPFAPGEVGNLVVIDVIHHLQRPLKFLRQAEAALQPGGRLIFCEPALTPWSKFIFSRHHEPIDTAADIFGSDPMPPEPDPNHTFANIAIPELLFFRQRAQTQAVIPKLKIIEARKFGFLLYPLTGGFSYPKMVPDLGYATLLRVEDFLLRPFAHWLTGIRMLVVLEKKSDGPT